METNIADFLEPIAGKMLSTGMPNSQLTSIAISLKRIADALEKPKPEAPDFTDTSKWERFETPNGVVGYRPRNYR